MNHNFQKGAKKILSALLVVLMLATTALPVFASPSAVTETDSAEEMPTEQIQDEEQAQLSGETYEIRTALDFYDIRNDLSGTYLLMNDIDLSDYKSTIDALTDWEPIGTFSGSFDGQGHTITGINIRKVTQKYTYTNDSYHGYYYVGLFGLNKGTIKNVNIHVDVNSHEIVKALVSGRTNYYHYYVGGLVGKNEGTIQNCHVTGSVKATIDVSATYNDICVGGLVGYQDADKTISNCSSSATVYAEKKCSGSEIHVGGLIGSCHSHVSKCFNTGSVTYKFDAETADNTCYVGGIAGKLDVSSGTSLDESYSTGNITIIANADYGNITSYAGGITGLTDRCTVKNSYATGNISSSVSSNNGSITSYSGGCVGYLGSGSASKNSYFVGEVTATAKSSLGTAISHTGGFAGRISGAAISNSYAIGKVTSSASSVEQTASSYVGGFVGDISGSTGSSHYSISKSYADAEIISNTNSDSGMAEVFSGGFIGISTSNMFGINNSYSKGNATANASSKDGKGKAYVGGFMGYSNNTKCTYTFSHDCFDKCKISRCYSTGIPTGVASGTPAESHVGGFIGYLANTDMVSSCLFDTDTSCAQDLYVTGLKTYEMMHDFEYKNFDFTSTWAIDENTNGGYPYLRAVPVEEDTPSTPVTGIEMRLVLKVGDILNLSANVLPENASNNHIAWHSSNNDVVSVTSDGTVKALADGNAIVTAQTSDGAKTATCYITVKTEIQPDIEAGIIFDFKSVTETKGATIEVPLILNNDKEINSVGIHKFVFDTQNLEFLGFNENEEFTANALFKEFDADNKAITIGWENPGVYSGEICKVVYKIKDTALEGHYDISAASVVKNYSVVMTSNVNGSRITVINGILGDISCDGSLDINDATLLFQHSMLPEAYPISYIGSIDFYRNGHIDIGDAIYLFQHTMMPDVYPLN